MANYKSLRPMFAEDLVVLGPSDTQRGTEVFIRARLTSQNLDIMNEWRKNKDVVKYVWEQKGMMVARLEDEGKVTEITSLKHFNEYVQANKGQSSGGHSGGSRIEID